MTLRHLIKPLVLEYMYIIKIATCTHVGTVICTLLDITQTCLAQELGYFKGKTMGYTPNGFQ